MKTSIKYITLFTFAVLLVSANMFAGGFEFEEENYIDDIPFNTENIYSELMSQAMVFEIEDESYVDDIPFNTESVKAQNNFASAIAIEFAFEDEDYIDDIPFNTEAGNKENNCKNHFALNR